MKRLAYPLLTLILLFLISQSILAAAPVTHAVLAEKWIAFHENYNDAQKRSFILGTLFPDIRYLKVISRDKTHEKGITVPRLLESQSEFTKGKRLHALVDKAREKLVVKWKMYDVLEKIPGSKYKATFLKLLEDEILFASQDWGPVRQYLDYIHPEEIAFEIAEADLRKWHQNQRMAFNSPPSQYLNSLVIMNKNFASVPVAYLSQWSKLLVKYAEEPSMQQYVNNLMKEFDKILQET